MFLDRFNLPGERTRRVSVRPEPATASLPVAGGELCWHCCHAFDGEPVPLPVSYDPETDEFAVVGRFCSFPCMKAYNSQRASYKKDTNVVTISLFALRYFGERMRVPCAPPRQRLRAFGGDLSIDAFREAAVATPAHDSQASSATARKLQVAAAIHPDARRVRLHECGGDDGSDGPPPVRAAPPAAAALGDGESSPAAAPAQRRRKPQQQPAGPAAPENAMLKLKRTKPTCEPDVLSTLMGLTIRSSPPPDHGKAGPWP